MSTKDDDIFTDDFKKLDTKLKELHSNQPTISDDIRNTTSRRTLIIIGAVVVGLIIGGSAYGIQMGIINLNIQPFDQSRCQYGVTHDLIFAKRCMTEEEYKKSQETPKPTETPTGGGGTTDVSSTSDKVELEKTNEPIGYYMVTSEGDWYGDYVDFRKIPNKIEKTGSMKVNFRCFTDDFLKTSTYFGTFRNVIQDYLKVEVYIGDNLINSMETTTNRALILEGSCY